MEINKKFYHGTSVQNFAKIIESKGIKQMDNSCATDDFHYAKNYAILEYGIGVVFMFRIKSKMNIKSWLLYWLNRNIIRKLIGWNKYVSELYTNIFENSWGFVENSMEININDIPLCNIEKIYLVENHK